MNGAAFAGDKASAERMDQMPLGKQLVMVSFLLIICTKPCSAIGSWGKKITATEAENSIDVGSNSYMEKTYLDLFGESAKEFLTKKAPEKLKTTFPATDKDCRWDWRYIRCEPYCGCSLQPKIPFDFHFGRACRKRSHLGRGGTKGQIGTKKTPFEEIDEMYRLYCNMEHEKPLTPPPPSIPSPFPFLAKSGKATWNILRNKADPVVEKAIDEFEILHGRVQTVVCKDLKIRCNENEREGSSGNYFANSSTPMEFAWQERLFCRDVVHECNASSPQQN